MEGNSLCKEDLDNIKLSVIESIMKVLPNILEEITPLLIEKAKDVIAETTTHVIQTRMNSTLKDKSIKEDVDNFIYQNKTKFYELLNKRKDVFWKYTRMDRSLLLFNECLAEEP